jgi:hypothetical protein
VVPLWIILVVAGVSVLSIGILGVCAAANAFKERRQR